MTLDEFYDEWHAVDAAEPETEKHVLLVEDDPFWQNVISRNIRRATDACKITYVTTAEQAIVMLNSNHPFNLIIADQFLDGDKTGYDLWRVCQERGFHVPFLLTSGNADFPEQVIMKDPIHFVSKPFVAAELRRNLAELLTAGEIFDERAASQWHLKERSKGPILGIVFALIVLTAYSYSYISGVDTLIQQWPEMIVPPQPFIPMPEDILAPPPPSDMIEFDGRIYGPVKHG